MQSLYGRHPKIRMGVELLIKPCRSAFVGSDAHEIGLHIACERASLLFPGVVVDASFEWPRPAHLCITFLPAAKKQGSETKIYS
jgi:hypothetical protein